jgi:hypothetical protein
MAMKKPFEPEPKSPMPQSSEVSSQISSDTRIEPVLQAAPAPLTDDQIRTKFNAIWGFIGSGKRMNAKKEFDDLVTQSPEVKNHPWYERLNDELKR